jgi:hypothetical protein
MLPNNDFVENGLTSNDTEHDDDRADSKLRFRNILNRKT